MYGDKISHLEEIPQVYFVERTQWNTFKRALENCGLTWRLPDWRTTYLYQGDELKQMLDGNAHLKSKFDKVFPPPQMEVGNKEKIDVFDLSNTFLKALKVKPLIPEELQSKRIFCNLTKLTYEPETLLPARQKFWAWFVAALLGPTLAPGPYFYLTRQVPIYDLGGLFMKLSKILDVLTICTLDDEVNAVTSLEFNPSKQDIFSYAQDLLRAIAVLNETNARLDGAGVVLSDTYIRTRIVRAARKVPTYKTYIDNIIAMPVEKWTALTYLEILTSLEAIRGHEDSFTPRREIVREIGKDVVKANFAKQEKQKRQKKVLTCNEFTRNGSCSKTGCRYTHQVESKAPPPALPSKKKKEEEKKCTRCASTSHTYKECSFTGNCTWCGKANHKEEVCKKKAAGQPQVNFTVAAHVVTVGSFPQTDPLCLTTRLDGMAKETFYVDSGSNANIHKNYRAASSFYRTSIDIGTASGLKSMQSDGMGSLMLYTADGKPMPGFDKVVFAQKAVEKLASVGELCDSGLVCVFTKKGLSIYDESVVINGSPIIQEERCPKTRLYPMTLYRKVGERGNDIKQAVDVLGMMVKTYDAYPPGVPLTPPRCAYEQQIEDLPEFIDEGDALPCALLARTYRKVGLSDLDRYHAKFGDIGVKYLKRCLPELHIPKQYRCETCIDAKMHKFSHRPAPPGARVEYLPGVCIHTDHSGPYARSINGARYSQLFLDRGSGYLWAFRQSQKTEHYDALPKVLLDSRALSGRPVQILQSDGDGVFTGKRTMEILETEKIRHEFSAPYDSDTNAFIERARRTVFEGVATALLRSGAPANFWGEAECHKIFTLNVLPTQTDPAHPGNFCSRKNLLEGNRKPFDLERLMAFGTAITCWVPDEKRKGGKEPAQRKSFTGVVLGYVDGMPAYRVWDLQNSNVKLISYNFTICHEGFYPFREKKNWPENSDLIPIRFSPVMDGVLSITEWKKYDFDRTQAEEILASAPDLLVDAPEIPEAKHEPEEKSAYSEPQPEPQLEPNPPERPKPPPVAPVAQKIPVQRVQNFWKEKLDLLDQKTPDVPKPVELPTRRSLRGWTPSEKSLTNLAHLVETQPTPTMKLGQPFEKPIGIMPPKTLWEARISPWWPQYREAAQREYDGHLKSGTWEVVPRDSVPKTKNILRGKWVWDDKRDQNGKLLKFKARFVAMGCTQKEGEDYQDTFAGVVVGKSFRLMLAMLAIDSELLMEHWDVRMAFTQAPLEDELYMEEPEEFITPKKRMVLKLKKSIYGLKQSAHNWAKFLREILRAANFFPIFADPCVFLGKTQDKHGWAIASTHVDDIFILYNTQGKALRDGFFNCLSSKVEVENLGPVAWALKTHIMRDPQKCILKISQEAYTAALLQKKGINFPSSSRPISPCLDQISPTAEEKFEILEKAQYQSDIGALWWLAQISRPDIFYAVHRCAKMVNQPTKNLTARLAQIFNYLAQTHTLGLVFEKPKQPVESLLTGFADAAFATEDETQSRIGWFFQFSGNLIGWASENTSRVMTSSTEAECRAISQFVKENLWQRQIQNELKIFEVQQPTIVFEDNTSTIFMANDQGSPHKKTKHFGIEWAQAKESVALGELKLVHVPTEDQVADIMTKQLPVKQFIHLRDLIMGGQEKQNYFSMNLTISSMFILGDVAASTTGTASNAQPPNVTSPGDGPQKSAQRAGVGPPSEHFKQKK
jgi:hypothetical protein